MRHTIALSRRARCLCCFRSRRTETLFILISVIRTHKVAIVIETILYDFYKQNANYTQSVLENWVDNVSHRQLRH